MSFSKKKKLSQFYAFERLLKRKTSFFMLSVTHLTVLEKLQLKLDLKEMGYDFIVLKNKVFIKQLKLNYPKFLNIIPLVQGSCIIVYPTLSVDSKVPNDYEGIKSLGKYLEKKVSYLFLGGFFDNKLINKDFLKEVLNLKSLDAIYQDIINLLNHPKQNLYNIIQSPSNKMHYPITELIKIKKED
jgi:ribosomal protein L10